MVWMTADPITGHADARVGLSSRMTVRLTKHCHALPGGTPHGR